MRIRRTLSTHSATRAMQTLDARPCLPACQRPFQACHPAHRPHQRCSSLKATADRPSQPVSRPLLQFAGEVVLVSALVLTPPAWAADTAKVGTCLLSSCQTALAGCIGDVKCLQNLVCLQACNGQPDETGCQIRCGDLYEVGTVPLPFAEARPVTIPQVLNILQDAAVDTFNSCAVSDKKCVPQRVDKGAQLSTP